jgi:hypothetical protein
MEYYSASGLRTCVFSVTKHKRPLYKYKNSLFLSFTFLNWAAVGKLKEFLTLPCVSTKLVHGLLVEVGLRPQNTTRYVIFFHGNLSRFFPR